MNLTLNQHPSSVAHVHSIFFMLFFAFSIDVASLALFTGPVKTNSERCVARRITHGPLADGRTLGRAETTIHTRTILYGRKESNYRAAACSR